MTERLKRNLLIRHAPVTALCIMVAVCVTGLGFIRHQWLAILTTAPVVLAIILYCWQARSR
jgi:hypothetical protein